MALLAPSMLAADFNHLAKAIAMVNESAAHWFHLDVMDGRFVPNISFGMFIVEAIHTLAQKPLDVHLMIVEPEKYITAFRNAGAENITVHFEACTHLHRTLQQIRDTGAKAGIALNPHTPVHLLEDCILEADLVCLMSVNPGFGGQRFIANTIKKTMQLKSLILSSGSQALIEIDGGVTPENAKALTDAGADVLVAGSSFFGAPDPFEAARRMLVG